MKVLVLDDHDGFREEVMGMLSRNNYEVVGAGNADAAIPLAEKGDFDFILVDFSMPTHDGIWFMRNVKLPRTTKALLVTAYIDKEMMAQMFKLGIVGYLIKPFDEEDVLRYLEFYSRRSAPVERPVRKEISGE
jgi:DNA-binding response OmpR family regulator